MKRIVLIGSGNLAESLLLALCRQGENVVQIYARNQTRGATLAAMCQVPHTANPEALVPADIYLVAVSDRAVGEVTQSLPIPAEAIVAHTAGSVEINTLPHQHCGSFYPFQSFTAGRRVDFSTIPIFVEGADSDTEEQLEALAKRLSNKVFRANGAQRRKIHLAGVFACNFVNALYGVGADLLREEGIPFDVLTPLMEETYKKASSAPHPTQVQTGPAVRGDRNVQERHLAQLNDEKIKNIYRNLSDLIWETSKKTSQK